MKIKCDQCLGEGQVFMSEDGQDYYEKCPDCGGTGEVDLLSPHLWQPHEKYLLAVVKGFGLFVWQGNDGQWAFKVDQTVPIRGMFAKTEARGGGLRRSEVLAKEAAIDLMQHFNQ